MQLENLFFKNKEVFHEWLEENHQTSPGIWMIFYKKHTNIQCIDYNDALDEALCFGWIDSIIKSVDPEKYLRKFSPRINLKNWSDINKNKVYKLIESGRMKEAGLKKIESYLKTGKVEWPETKDTPEAKEEIILPDFILDKFSENEKVLINFKKLSKTYQLQYISWITSAKRKETIEKRIVEAAILLEEGKKLGMK